MNLSVVIGFIAIIAASYLFARGMIASIDYLSDVLDGQVRGLINGHPDEVDSLQAELAAARYHRIQKHGFDPLDQMPRNACLLIHDPADPDEVSRQALRRI